MLRFGLCCIFKNEPIKFRSFTAKHLLTADLEERLARISAVCLANSESLMAALKFCRANNIGAFRISSPFLPRYTHPEVGYRIDQLPDAGKIQDNLASARNFQQQHDIRLSFHPDQFIILSSPRPDVVDKSIKELEYQGMLAEMTGADVINIHGGGKYDNAGQALMRFKENFARLSQRVRSRLTLENDDRLYTVAELLPVCESLQIPLVYDVHHHRCNPDGLSVEAATTACVETWRKQNREPYFHLSSPKSGWQSGNPKPHADFIDPADFPQCWSGLTATVDIEAKAKELAVIKLQRDLSG